MDKWWETTRALRAFTSNHQIADESEFIAEWLALTRATFRVDFSFATLVTEARKIEAAAPRETAGSSAVSAFVNAFFKDLSTSSSLTLVEDVDLHWGFRSLAAASVSPSGNAPSGVVAIGNCSRSDFTSPELFHFQAAAEELGSALDRFRFRKIFERNKILVEIGERAEFLDLKDLLADITARVRTHLRVGLCAIRLIDKKEQFWPVALSPNSQGNLQYLLSPHCPNVTPDLFENRRSIAICNRRKKQASLSFFQTYLGTRLLSKPGKLIGLLELYRGASHGFDTEEIVFLEELAQLASLALNQSKLPLLE
jgi:GAF domain-containing protein